MMLNQLKQRASTWDFTGKRTSSPITSIPTYALRDRSSRQRRKQRPNSALNPNATMVCGDARIHPRDMSRPTHYAAATYAKCVGCNMCANLPRERGRSDLGFCRRVSFACALGLPTYALRDSLPDAKSRPTHIGKLDSRFTTNRCFDQTRDALRRCLRQNRRKKRERRELSPRRSLLHRSR